MLLPSYVCILELFDSHHDNWDGDIDWLISTGQKLVDMNINTVLGSVTWEDIEPDEGNFDFTILDGVVKGARAHGLHLVLLWFGSFKNGRSPSRIVNYLC